MLRPIIKAGVYRLLYQVLLFAASLSIAAMVGIDQFGAISLMIINAAALIIVTDFGTGAAIVWHEAGSEMPGEKIFSFAAGSGMLQLILFLAGEVVSIKSSGRTLLARQEASQYYVQNEVAYFCGLVLTEKYTSLFYGRHKAATLNRILSLVCGGALVLFVADYFKYVFISPFTVFCWMFLGMGVCCMVVFHLKAQRIAPAMLRNHEMRSLVSFSAIVFITNIIQFFAYRLDFWLVDRFYNDGQLGIYAQANRFAQLMWVLPTLLASLIIPALRKSDQPLDRATFLRILRTLNLASVFLAAAIVLIAFVFYHWFLPSRYLPGLIALHLMLPGYFFFITTTLLAAWFSANRWLLTNFIGSTLCFATILGADLVLIPRYSINGAAIANTIAYGLTTLYFIARFKKQQDVPTKDLFLFRKQDIFALRKLI